MKSSNPSRSEKDQAKLIDDEIALGWLRNPPKLPPSENPLDVAYPPVIWIKSSLSELVTKWNVSAVEAELAFQSWAKARRTLRTLRLTGNIESTKEKEMQKAIKSEFWAEPKQDSKPTPMSVRLRDLAESIHDLEQAGQHVSSKWVIEILSDLSIPEARLFLKWLVHHWILPEGDMPPLCLCTDSLIIKIDALKRVPLISINSQTPEAALRQLIHDHGLYRPKKPRIRESWLDQKL